MPLRARILALLAMWTAVSVSLTVLALRGTLQPWLAAVILVAAASGTVMILTWRREATAPASRRD